MIRTRYICVVGVGVAFASSVLSFVVAAAKTIKAYQIYFFGASLTASPPPHLDRGEQAIIAVIEATDAVLLAIVLFVLATGIYNLFLGELKTEFSRSWLKIDSIERLKQVLMEVILVLLAVFFLRNVFLQGETFSFEMLVLPAGILMIAAALKLMDWRRH